MNRQIEVLSVITQKCKNYFFSSSVCKIVLFSSTQNTTLFLNQLADTKQNN